MEPAKVRVEVVYVGTQVHVRAACVLAGTSILDVIRQSAILEECPQIDLHRQRVGIFGRFVALSTEVKAGDRIEIYESLLEDPKDARRKRARAKNASRKYAGGSAAARPRSS
ncbi:MAG: RnfH family protein [Acidiferrobacter sp.]